jgi:hypothetical protein
MAVYTEVTDDDLTQFIAGYDLGKALSFKGIPCMRNGSRSRISPSFSA